MDEPIQWQKIKKCRSLPDYMQTRHSYVFDQNGKQLYNPNGSPVTDSRLTINYMKLGKMKQEIAEYKALMNHETMMVAYQQLFLDRYPGIQVDTLTASLANQGIDKIISVMEEFSRLEYLGEYEKGSIKSLCVEHGLPTSIGKINELLEGHSSNLRLVSKQKKTKGVKIQSWVVEGYDFSQLQ